MAKKKAPAKKKAAPAKKSTSKRKSVAQKAPVKKKTVSPKKAREKKTRNLIIGVGTALAMGALEARGLDQKIPQVEALGASGTLGIVGVLAGIYMKNDDIEEAGKTLLILAANKMGYAHLGAPTTAPAATKGDFRDVGAIPTAAMLPPGTPVIGVDPKLLKDTAEALQELSGDEDDDETAGDEDDETAGEFGDNELAGDEEDSE